MMDLTDILLESEKYNRLWSKESLTLFIENKEGITCDWDKACGERWATIYWKGRFAGYISSVIPLAFCKTTLDREISDFLEESVMMIKEDDFEDKKWYIDSQKLKQNTQKLTWIIEEQMLNLKQFSTNDFWYATI